MLCETSTSRLPRLPETPLEVLEVMRKQELSDFCGSTSRSSKRAAWKSIFKPLNSLHFQTSKTSTPKGVVRALGSRDELPLGRAENEDSMTKRKPIPQSVRFNVLRRDGFACRYCGRSSPDVVLHLDHVKPHSAGGEDGEDNLITSCEGCNYGKGAKTDVQPPIVKPPEDTAGFVGFFGHTFTDDDPPALQFQFHVLRQVAADRYAVQLFSWFMGDPTEIQVWDAETLSKAKLYATASAWTHAADEHQRKAGWGR